MQNEVRERSSSSARRIDITSSRQGSGRKEKGDQVALYPAMKCSMKKNGGSSQHGQIELFHGHFLFTSKVFGSKKKVSSNHHGTLQTVHFNIVRPFF
jgi:hypothetical protein